MRPHPRQQLAGQEGLHQIVVAAQLEGACDALLVHPGRHHQDRQVQRIEVLADAGTDLEAVDARHHQVQQHEIRPRPLLEQRRQDRGPVREGAHPELPGVEQGSRHAQIDRIVVHHPDGGQGRILGLALARRPWRRSLRIPGGTGRRQDIAHQGGIRQGQRLLDAFRRTRLGGCVPRQAETHPRAMPGGAAQLHASPVRLHDLAADGQAQTGTAAVRTSRLQRIEDLGDVLVADADPGILHLDADLVLRYRDRDHHPPLVGELERIAEQIEQHLLDALGVAGDERQGRSAQPQLQTQAARLEQWLHELHDLIEQAIEAAGGPVQHHAPLAGGGEVQDLVDEPQQPPSTGIDQAQGLRLRLGHGAACPCQQPSHQAENAIERGTQLVGDHGQKAVLEFVGAFQVADGRLLRLGALLLQGIDAVGQGQRQQQGLEHHPELRTPVAEQVDRNHIVGHQQAHAAEGEEDQHAEQEEARGEIAAMVGPEAAEHEAGKADGGDGAEQVDGQGIGQQQRGQGQEPGPQPEHLPEPVQGLAQHRTRDERQHEQGREQHAQVEEDRQDAVVEQRMIGPQILQPKPAEGGAAEPDAEQIEAEPQETSVARGHEQQQVVEQKHQDDRVQHCGHQPLPFLAGAPHAGIEQPEAGLQAAAAVDAQHHALGPDPIRHEGEGEVARRQGACGKGSHVAGVEVRLRVVGIKPHGDMVEQRIVEFENGAPIAQDGRMHRIPHPDHTIGKTQIQRALLQRPPTGADPLERRRGGEIGCRHGNPAWHVCRCRGRHEGGQQQQKGHGDDKAHCCGPGSNDRTVHPVIQHHCYGWAFCAFPPGQPGAGQQQVQEGRPRAALPENACRGLRRAGCRVPPRVPGASRESARGTG